MHTYNTRSNKHHAYYELIRDKTYPDAGIIEVTDSDTKKGHHLRWHWSKASLAESDGSNSSSSSDSSDSSRESSPSDHSDASGDTERVVDGDGDSEMGDDQRWRTPQREEPYRPGSVAQTPRRGRIIHKAQRPDGGFDFWHTQDGAVLRLNFDQDGIPVKAESEEPERVPTVEHVHDAIEDVRRSLSPGVDDDAASVASDATVPVDPRATPQPTLFNGALPLVRHPTLPADYDQNAAGPSRGPANRLSTIREDSREELQWPPRMPEGSGIHMYRNANGAWVCEGSLGPNASYHVDSSQLPPRIDVQKKPAPAPAAPRTVRLGGRVLEVPIVEIRTSPRKR